MNALLVYDVDGWAWHNKALAIQKYMPKKYFDRVRIMNIRRFKENSKVEIAKTDSLHIFGFGQGRHWASISSTTVASYLMLEKARHERRKYLGAYRAIAAANRDLYEELRKDVGGKVWNIPNGFDTDIYCPGEPKPEDHRLVVGWAGKPMWKFSKERVGSYIAYMGLGGIWPELKTRLLEIPDIEVREMANLPSNAVSTEEMVRFYRSLDIFICPHFKCGTPNPAFEAAACGCCVITTPCGAFKEVAEARGAMMISGYIGNSDRERVDRVINDMVSWIKALKIHREAINITAQRGMEEIRNNWSWKTRVIPWGEMLVKARYR